MQKYNITNYEFFDAIRPTIKHVQKWNKKFCHHELYRVPHTWSLPRFLKYQIGCLGCLMSHGTICKLALDRKYKNILILEDDAEFILDFKKIFEFCEQINYDYDIFYLAGNHEHAGRTRIRNNVMRIKGTLTTGGYLIKEKAMQYIIDNITGYPKEVDVFYAQNLQPKFKSYCSIPHIIKQRPNYSDIQQTNVEYNVKALQLY